MEKTELKKQIMSLTQDITFEYHGKSACINPWAADKFQVGFGDVAKTYTNIKYLIEDPLYDGKSLSQICEDLKIELV